MKKKALRWLIYLVIGLIIVAVAFVFSIDPIAKRMAERRVEAETGMKTKIGRFNVGLRSATIHIHDLTLKNPPEFGGGTFVEIPELYFEYDRSALSEGILHLNLVRININEIHIVENESGKKNTDRLQKYQPKPEGSPHRSPVRTTPPSPARTNSGHLPPSTNAGVTTETLPTPPRQAPLDIPSAPPGLPNRVELPSSRGEPVEPELVFDGVELLDVTLRTVKFTHLGRPDQNLEQDLGIRNETFRNLKTEKDFETAGALIAIKAGVSFLLSGDLAASRILLKQSSKIGKESKNVLEELAEPVRPIEKPTNP